MWDRSRLFLRRGRHRDFGDQHFALVPRKLSAAMRRWARLLRGSSDNRSRQNIAGRMSQAGSRCQMLDIDQKRESRRQTAPKSYAGQLGARDRTGPFGRLGFDWQMGIGVISFVLQLVKFL